MSSYGHVGDMMERYASNRELLKAKRRRHFRKSAMYKEVNRGSGHYPLGELNKAEWEQLKKRIKADKKRERWLWVGASLVVVIALLLFIYWLF